MEKRAPWFVAGLVLAALAAWPAVAADAIKPISSTVAEANHVICTGPCLLRSLYITTGGTAGYLMTVDAASPPAAGGAAIAPLNCVYAPVNTSLSLDYGDTGEPYSTGLVVIFSSTGCFTNTASATAFFKARKQ
jgi:opacity protein-like surface antigen